MLQSDSQVSHVTAVDVCLATLLSMRGYWRNRLLSRAKIHFRAVAQMVGFGLGRSKMLYLSMGVD